MPHRPPPSLVSAEEVCDWGVARSRQQQHATLDLLNAVADGNGPRTTIALAMGAATNAVVRVSPVLLRQHGQRSPANGASPLDLALLLEPSTHATGVVEALLAAGAEPPLRLGHLPFGSAALSQDDDHPAYRALEAAVLDRLAQGRGRVWRPEDRDHQDLVSDVPGNVPRLWVHRARELGRWDAINGWFDQGGLAALPKAQVAQAFDQVAVTLWMHHLLDPTTVRNHRWLATLHRLEAALMSEPRADLFRAEMIAVLSLNATLARDGSRADSAASPPLGKRDHLNAWCDRVLQQRPLAHHRLDPNEVLPIHREAVRARLRCLEQAVLAQALPQGTYVPRARPRL